MEQLKQIGEMIGNINAMMVFREEIEINQRQCCLLVDMFTSAYTTISQEMKKNLRFEERNSKWKVLENPLKEILRIFKEGEIYIKQCQEIRDWRIKTILLYQNKDCVEFHIHDLMSHLPMVIEAIEIAGENSGLDHDEIQKKSDIYSLKYQRDCRDPKIFQWKFGDQYVVTQDLCNRIDSVYDEDRWMLRKKLQEWKILPNSSKSDQELADALLRSLNACNKLLPSSILMSSDDYKLGRSSGEGSQYKEMQWLGESFTIRHILGDLEEAVPNPMAYFDLSHPNLMNVLCCFADDERKDCLVVMDLMSRDFSSCIKESYGFKKRVPFSVPVTIDLLLQIARGMEYLHHKKIYHGDLNPSNIFIKGRNVSIDGYMQAKVAGFGLSSHIRFNTTKEVQSSFIWYPPEFLAEQKNSGNAASFHPTEKADVYSFGMVCFEILTGKVPFEDFHLQGDQMSRNIRTGERPLFPSNAPKYLTSLTKKCWHGDPNQRPSFSSICRILRYMKKFLVMNLDSSQSMSQMDYNDIEAGFLRCFPSLSNSEIIQPVTQIPFHMFAYKVGEKEKSNHILRDTSESGSEAASLCGDDNVIINVDDRPPTPPIPSPKKPVKSSEFLRRRSLSWNNITGVPTLRHSGKSKLRNSRPPQVTSRQRPMRINSENNLMLMSAKTRRKSGHLSDSELP